MRTATGMRSHVPQSRRRLPEEVYPNCKEVAGVPSHISRHGDGLCEAASTMLATGWRRSAYPNVGGAPGRTRTPTKEARRRATYPSQAGDLRGEVSTAPAEGDTEAPPGRARHVEGDFRGGKCTPSDAGNLTCVAFAGQAGDLPEEMYTTPGQRQHGKQTNRQSFMELSGDFVEPTPGTRGAPPPQMAK